MFIKGTPDPATRVVPAKTQEKAEHVGFQETQIEVGGELIGKTKIHHILH